MPEILFIKTSSLGDVVHMMPAATDARRHFPRARLAWVVEEAYAPLVRLHPAIDEVIPVASRRWRRRLLAPSTWSEMRTFVRHLRTHHYEAVIDTQGLLRSALIAKVARGTRHGYDADSIRERAASRFYDARHAVSRTLHAIDRNRILTGFAFGYPPEPGLDYGLVHPRLTIEPEHRYAVLIHGSARPAKRWNESGWVELARALADQGLDLHLPAGSGEERLAAERIATAAPRARVAEPMPIDEIAQLIAGAALVVGVDTGLLHIAAALNIPLVAIFIASEPGLTGPKGSGPIAVLGAKGAPPSAAQVIDASRQLLSQGR